MTPALIVFVILAILLLIISVIIWKSAMTENDKIVSLIMILAVFSLVAIVNEVKRASSSKKQIEGDAAPKLLLKPELKMMEREFFKPISGNTPEFSALPVGEKEPFYLFSDIASIFFSSSPESVESYQMFTVYRGSKRNGKSFEAKNLALRLQDELAIPSLYISLGSEIASASQLIQLMGFDHLSHLEDTVKQLNKKGKTPFIFIDNGHNLVASNGASDAPSLLNSLYHNTEVNLIILLSEEHNEQANKLGKWLKNAEFKNLPERTLDTWKEYVQTHLNPLIAEESKKITASDIDQCDAVLNIDWNLLNEYKENLLGVNSLTEFCNNTVKTLAKQYQAYPELLSIGKAILKLSKRENGTVTNDWVPFGKLKASNIPNLLVNLEELVTQGHLDAKDGKFRLKGKSSVNAFASLSEDL